MSGTRRGALHAPALDRGGGGQAGHQAHEIGLAAGGGLVEQASPALVVESVDQVAATIEQLRAAGYVYEGRLPPPKGASIEDWEDREQTLFRSTRFGDDVVRPMCCQTNAFCGPVIDSPRSMITHF